LSILEKKVGVQMANNYNLNQMGAIATLLATALWGATATGAGIALGRLDTSAATVFGILTIIAWIIIPLYFKLVKWGYIIGIIVFLLALILMIISPVLSPGAIPWYAFAEPIYDFSHVLVYLVMIVGIYFAYNSYKEL
jgi:hypothetical protein